MKLFGKTYKEKYVDSGSGAKNSDHVSMLYLQSRTDKSDSGRVVALFTDFVSFDKSNYDIVAIAFAPMRSFYFSNSFIKNYTNRVEDYKDFVLIKWASGLVKDNGKNFSSIQSIATKVLRDSSVIDDNRRALCTVGTMDHDFKYQDRYGEGTASCDRLMNDYCSIHTTDKACSCIAHKEYLRDTAGIDPRYTSMLKPYCHVADCATDGYLSAGVLNDKRTGNCAPVNMCIQNMNISDSSILNSNVIMQCTQEQENTTTTPKDTDEEGPNTGNQTVPGDLVDTSGGGISGGGISGSGISGGGTSSGGTSSGGTSSGGTSSGGTSGGTSSGGTSSGGTSSGGTTAQHWLVTYWPVVLLIFIVIVVLVVFIKKRRDSTMVVSPAYLYNREYFTVDSTFNDNFVGTEFSF